VPKEARAKPKPGQKKTRSRKAANLAELQRYYSAAAEAAKDIMVQSNDSGGSAALPDFTVLAKTGPTVSPTKLVALNLNNGSELFRERLKSKLEETGGVACHIQVGKQKRTLPSNPPMPKDEMKEPDSDEKKNNRRKKKVAAVLNHGPPKREAMRFSRNLGASSECDDACDVLSEFPDYNVENNSTSSAHKSRKRRDLIVTIDEADNYAMGPPAKRRASSSSSSSSMPPPEDTPRCVYDAYSNTIMSTQAQ